MSDKASEKDCDCPVITPEVGKGHSLECVYGKENVASGEEHLERELIKELIATPENYERDHSHTHCYEYMDTPACGLVAEKHLACCICSKPKPNERERALDELTKMSEDLGLY